MIEQIYVQLSALFPRSVLNSTRTLLVQNGIGGISSRTYLGFSTFASIALAVFSFIATVLFTKDQLIAVAAAVVVAVSVQALFYLVLSMGADSRAKKIEILLPEGLQLISANMRAGMTLENAVWSSAVPEFGPLRDEIQKMSADVFAGKPISHALLAMGSRVRSPIVERTIRLIAEGVKLGGEMAPLLDEVSSDIRSTQSLHKEIQTSTTTYVMFIVFAAMIAAPMLFSISSFYAKMNEDNFTRQVTKGVGMKELPAASGIPSIGLSLTKPPGPDTIRASDIQLFSFGAIAMTNFFAGLILGQLGTGKWTEGLKYSPIFIIVSLAIYSASLGMLGATLGKLV